MSARASSSRQMLDRDVAAPSFDELSAYVLQHPLLSSALPSSQDLDAEIESLSRELEEDREQLQRHTKLAHDELDRAHERISRFRDSLDVLPAEIASLEDAIDSLSQTLQQQGGANIRAQLIKQQSSLQSLTSAQSYFAILSNAQSLWEATAKAEIEGDGAAALERLAELANLFQYSQKLFSEVASSQPQPPLRLLPFLQTKLHEAHSDLRERRTVRLREALEKVEWPPLSPEQASAQGKAVRSPSSILLETPVQKAWDSLVSLQIVASMLQIEAAPSCLVAEQPMAAPGSSEYHPLYVTSVLVEPYLLRFRFHFDSSRTTNRLDKPEWYLNHILGLVRSLMPLYGPHSTPRGPALKLTAQSLRRYGKSMVVTPEADLIHVLLKPLQAKVSSSVSLLVEQADPQLLAHFVASLLSFDDELDETTPFGLPTAPVRLSADVLSSQSWFDAWVNGEKGAAFRAFEDIFEDGDAWTIGNVEGDDMEEDGPPTGSWAAATTTSASSRREKTTRSARAVVRLVEGLTSTYSSLPQLSQRLQFLSEIQLPLLRAYQQRITRSLDAFESLSSAFARAIPGGIDSSTGMPLGDQDMVRGLRGLSRLLKALLSATHVHEALRQWQDTSFFLEMSNDLLEKDEGRSLLKRWKDEAEDRELDSESLGSLIRKGWRSTRAAPAAATARGAQGGSIESVWDEPLSRFRALSSRAHEGIQRLVTSEVSEGLRAYSQGPWTDEVSPMSPESQVETPTRSLLGSLSLLHTHLTHLLPAVSLSTAAQLYRAISREVSQSVVSRTVLGAHGRFNGNGAERFGLDWEQGWAGAIRAIVKETAPTQSGQQASSVTVASDWTMGLDATQPWRYLRDVATLLALPSNSSGGSSASTSSTGWTLGRATMLLWNDDGGDDDDGWRRMRQELGLTSSELSKDRAKEVVKRRIECVR